jgi:26S proteasome regulatory subunit N1
MWCFSHAPLQPHLSCKATKAPCTQVLLMPRLSGPPLQAAHQAPAVMGLALIAMAEPLGSQMALRALEHVLQYGEPAVRRAVPLALAIINTSNPDASSIDTLGRLSHDTDQEVAQNAILSLGFIGAGGEQL